jgi:hypothetical protein
LRLAGAVIARDQIRAATHRPHLFLALRRASRLGKVTCGLLEARQSRWRGGGGWLGRRRLEWLVGAPPADGEIGSGMHASFWSANKYQIMSRRCSRMRGRLQSRKERERGRGLPANSSKSCSTCGTVSRSLGSLVVEEI